MPSRIACSTIGVRTGPGATATTRTPRGAHSIPSTRVRPASPPLLAPYGPLPGTPTNGPVTDATLTMTPFPRASMRVPTAWQQRAAPIRFTSST